jgi:hypothetical protein
MDVATCNLDLAEGNSLLSSREWADNVSRQACRRLLEENGWYSRQQQQLKQRGNQL